MYSVYTRSNANVRLDSSGPCTHQDSQKGPLCLWWFRHDPPHIGMNASMHAHVHVKYKVNDTMKYCRYLAQDLS